MVGVGCVWGTICAFLFSVCWCGWEGEHGGASSCFFVVVRSSFDPPTSYSLHLFVSNVCLSPFLYRHPLSPRLRSGHVQGHGATIGDYENRVPEHRAVLDYDGCSGGAGGGRVLLDCVDWLWRQQNVNPGFTGKPPHTLPQTACACCVKSVVTVNTNSTRTEQRGGAAISFHHSVPVRLFSS